MQIFLNSPRMMRFTPARHRRRVRVGERLELRDEVREALDRTRRQGREEDGEDGEVERVADRLAPVHAHLVQVVDELEGEERDAEREPPASASRHHGRRDAVHGRSEHRQHAVAAQKP